MWGQFNYVVVLQLLGIGVAIMATLFYLAWVITAPLYNDRRKYFALPSAIILTLALLICCGFTK